MSNTNSVFIVIGHSGSGNEVYIMGVYPTLALVHERMDWLESDEGKEQWGINSVYYEIVAAVPRGTDCEIQIV